MLRELFDRVMGAGPAQAGVSGASPDVSPAQAQERMKQGSLLVDVREPEEWRSGHAPGATHIPLGQLPARMGELPPDREIITVCRSGNRSAKAAGQLRGAGYGNVHNLTGGMTAWSKDGFPVER